MNAERIANRGVHPVWHILGQFLRRSTSGRSRAFSSCSPAAPRRKARKLPWAPDGKETLFASRAEQNRAEVYLKGGPPRPLTHSPADCTAPNWSRDGEWIYFSSSRKGTQQIWSIPTGGGDPVQITKRGGVF